MNETEKNIAGPHFFATSEGSLHGEDTPENRELVRRIHACVNACEGISTEELEAGIIDDMRRVIAEVAPLFEQHTREAQENADTSPQLTVREKVSAN